MSPWLRSKLGGKVIWNYVKMEIQHGENAPKTEKSAATIGICGVEKAMLNQTTMNLKNFISDTRVFKITKP